MERRTFVHPFIINHTYCSDLIDFDALDSNDVFGNNDLAFRIAETHLGIPALLDATDMVECEFRK